MAERSTMLGLLIKRDDAGTAETEIMLEGTPGAVHLGRSGVAAQLPRQFVALRQSGGAKRMPLRQQTAGGIGDHLAAIGVVAVLDERFSAALFTEAQCFVGD